MVSTSVSSQATASNRHIRGPAAVATEKELVAAFRARRLTLLAWTVLSIVSFAWDVVQMRETTLQLARTEAETHFNNETALRNWIAAREGVYVAPDGQTQPSPFRSGASDQNMRSGGKRLTLVVASHLTRLLHESSAQRYGSRGRLTSTTPINPVNTPAQWEQAAYTAFAAGAADYAAVVEEDGKPYYGLVHVLKATASCLECHTDPKLKADGILGASSILVDLAPYRQIEQKGMRSGALTHGVTWLVGLFGIFAAFRIGIARLRERRETQEVLLESQHLFQTIADYSSDWVFWRNPDGSFRYVSPACERISGFAPEAFYADPALFLDIVHPDDKEAFRNHVVAADHGDILAPHELRILDRDGKLHFISHTCRPIHDSAGHFIGVRGANHDISRLRENEQILIDQSRQAAMGEMIGNIAHQWRQPISAVGLILQNLQYDYDEGRLDPGKLHDYIDRGRDLIAAMSGTIDDFRNFFRPEHDPSLFDIGQTIREAIRIVHDSFRAHGIEIRCSDSAPRQVFGFPHELAQVLLNLMVNAKDAILERRIPLGVVEIGVVPAPEALVVTVRDNGGGIETEALPYIFDPYFTTKDKGTGIGLYMSRTIIGHMGGSLTARNIDGGAEFDLRLPAASPAGGTPS